MVIFDDQESIPPPPCPQCWQSMKYIRTIPAHGAFPARFAFYCASCRQAETIESSLPNPYMLRGRFGIVQRL
jgi:hypothetical protein